jgi:UPF0176 protein
MPPTFTVATLYRFVSLPDPDVLREPLRKAMKDAGLCGTLLLAEEGINGTIAGPPENLRAFVDELRQHERYGGRFADIDVKWSTADEAPFRKIRVRLKREIVSLGCPEVNPGDPENVGQYLDPKAWNELLNDPDVTLVDTRNDYEVQIGTFVSAAGPAINPDTHSFREFPSFVSERLDPNTHKKVAMFCTGGIRCEKSTALLKSRGFGRVYHLRGGILKYLEEVPEEESKFQGACFVFDRRVAVTHGLEETDHEMCFACGWATTPEDRQDPDYTPGVACPHCVGKHTPEQQARFASRQEQFKSDQGCD